MSDNWKLIIYGLSLIASAVAFLLYGMRSFKPSNYNEWIHEVRVHAVYYQMEPEAIRVMADSDVFFDWYEEGLTPGEAMKRYYRKKLGLPETDGQ